MNAGLHDIQHAKDTIARNPDVAVDAILNHPHKNWDGEAKMYLQGLIAPSAPSAVAEPITVINDDGWDELMGGVIETVIDPLPLVPAKLKALSNWVT